MIRAIAATPAGLAGLLIVGLIGCIALAAPLVAPADPIAVDLAARLLPPGPGHWLGTDQAGRDILSRLIWGARPSLAVGVLSVAIGAAGGITIGLLAGMLRGAWEQVLMRTMDGLASIPLLIWAIAIVGIIGVGPVRIGPWSLPNESKIVLLVGILYMPALARVTYGAALLEAQADYVLARRMQGVPTRRIMFGDVLPNCLSPAIVQATLLVAVGIVVEASLSFVGLGVEPPAPSWGGMLADARRFIFTGEWWTYVVPGLAISITVIGLNLLGDALGDAIDPRKSASPRRLVV
jgi:peptide/nickel transport system permease protein